MKLFLILFIAVCLRLLLIADQIQQPDFQWQQDNYLGYARGFYPDEDSRLFPGYPLVLRITGSSIMAGVAVNGFFALISILLFYRITQNLFLTFAFAVFPPIWVEQSVKVATEPMATCMLLAAFYLLQKKRTFTAGLISGLAVPVRLIALAFGAAGLATTRSRSFLAGFALGAATLPIFNFFRFGPTGILHQFTKNPEVGGAGGTAIGFWQIGQDLIRALDWGQYRIVASGSFYLVLSVLGLLGLIKTRHTGLTEKLAFFTLVFGFLFIFSLGPIPLLEEYSRFLVPLLPALFIGLRGLAQYLSILWKQSLLRIVSR